MKKAIVFCFAFTALADSGRGLTGRYDAIPMQSDTVCNLHIQLDEKRRIYNFTGELTASGKFLIQKEGNERFIVFKGLKMSYVDSRFSDQTSDVSGSLLQDTIIIQNYGNAMNDFMSIGICDEKYLYFVRGK